MDYFLTFALEFSFGYPKTIYSCKAWGGSILVAVYAVNDAIFFLLLTWMSGLACKCLD